MYHPSMRLVQLENVFRALNGADVRYLVVGGIAVVAHGYGRVTFDVDLVVQLEADNILRAFRALEGLGYRPRVPVTAEQFATLENRARWIAEKDMKVLNMHSDQQRATPIDLFVSEPFDFDATFDTSIAQESGDVVFRVVDLNTLLRMKREAGRPRDLDDVEHFGLLEDDD